MMDKKQAIRRSQPNAYKSRNFTKLLPLRDCLPGLKIYNKLPQCQILSYSILMENIYLKKRESVACCLNTWSITVFWQHQKLTWFLNFYLIIIFSWWDYLSQEPKHVVSKRLKVTPEIIQSIQSFSTYINTPEIWKVTLNIISQVKVELDKDSGVLTSRSAIFPLHHTVPFWN